MALNTLKCNHLTPLPFKGLNRLHNTSCVIPVQYIHHGQHFCFVDFTTMQTDTMLLVTPPPYCGAEYCHKPVRLSVGRCVCPRAYLWNRWTNWHEIFCADPLWPWLGPPLAALRYVMYFRFYGRRHVWP